MSVNLSYEGFIKIEITPKIQGDFDYAIQLAERLEVLSTNPTFTHETRGLAGALREHVEVLSGRKPKRKDTSFGTLDFLDYQIKMAEDRLSWAAKQIMSTNHHEKEEQPK